MKTLQQAIEQTRNMISESNPDPVKYFFCPVVALGVNSNIELIDEFYDHPDEASDSAKRLVQKGFMLRSCHCEARDYGHSKVTFNQHILVKHSTVRWGAEKIK